MLTAMLAPDPGLPNPARSHGGHLALADALDRILHRGVSVQGNLTIGLADVELLFMDLRLLLGSVDAIWPDGRPPAPAIRPKPSSSGPSAPATGVPRPELESHSGAHAWDDSNTPVAPNGRSGDRESSTADGLVRLVLTLVKLLHEVLERQAIRRMDAGRLTDVQIENIGTALFAQAEEISRLQQQFGFSDKDLSLDLSVPDGSL